MEVIVNGKIKIEDHGFPVPGSQLNAAVTQ
jgi:hypothetical protein